MREQGSSKPADIASRLVRLGRLIWPRHDVYHMLHSSWETGKVPMGKDTESMSGRPHDHTTFYIHRIIKYWTYILICMAACCSGRLGLPAMTAIGVMLRGQQSQDDVHVADATLPNSMQACAACLCSLSWHTPLHSGIFQKCLYQPAAYSEQHVSFLEWRGSKPSYGTHFASIFST